MNYWTQVSISAWLGLTLLPITPLTASSANPKITVHNLKGQRWRLFKTLTSLILTMANSETKIPTIIQHPSSLYIFAKSGVFDTSHQNETFEPPLNQGVVQVDVGDGFLYNG